MDNYGGYDIHRNLGAVSMGPPLQWTGPDPPEGSEVYLYNLPYDCSPIDVLLAASESSHVYTLWMRVEEDGTNKGFAFVEYANNELAQKAVADLHGTLIKGDRHMGAAMSIFLRELRFTGLPPAWNSNSLMQLLLTVTPRIQSIVQDPEGFTVSFPDGASTIWGLYHLKYFAVRTWGPGINVERVRIAL